MRYKLTIEYEGTNYKGWQRQESFPTIQQAIEEAIFKLSGEKATLHGSGRTDAGVHAYGQVAHFDLQSKTFKEYVIKNALNHYLKFHRIVIKNCETVDENFHARFSAKKRYYKYIIMNQNSPLALQHNRAWHIRENLCIDSMREGAKFLKGTHDFTSFRAAECQSKSPIKTIDELHIEKTDEQITFYISAKSFLHHMVRNIVGSLRCVGNGKWSAQDINTVLLAKDRKAAGMTAPPDGLYFLQVDY